MSTKDADIRHVGGVPWHEASVPPRRHHCWVQTSGWVGLHQWLRCACGAVADGIDIKAAREVGMSAHRQDRLWRERNTRSESTTCSLCGETDCPYHHDPCSECALPPFEPGQPRLNLLDDAPRPRFARVRWAMQRPHRFLVRVWDSFAYDDGRRALVFLAGTALWLFAGLPLLAALWPLVVVWSAVRCAAS